MSLRSARVATRSADQRSVIRHCIRCDSVGRRVTPSAFALRASADKSANPPYNGAL